VCHKDYITSLQAVFTIVPSSKLLTPVTHRLAIAPGSNAASNLRRARSIVSSATVLDIDLAAPIFLIPQDGFLTSPSTCALLVFSLGHFLLSTTPVSALKREELASDQCAIETMCSAAESACQEIDDKPDCFVCESIPPAVACVYDRMLLRITGLKSLMCSVSDKWWDDAAIAAGGWEVILPININVAVLKLVCSSPLAVPLRIAIAIPSIRLHVSRNCYMALFKIIDVFKAKGVQGDSQTSKVQAAEETTAQSIDSAASEQLASASADVISEGQINSVMDKVAAMSVSMMFQLKGFR
jgi:hypothetical protein